MKNISILIPTYNEALNIKILIDRISHCLKKIDWEIIFVDDNSPDKTSEKIEYFTKTQSNIKVVNRLNERGLAGAVITGLKYCKFQNIIVMDADLQHDPIYIPKLIKRIEKDDATIVIASRYFQSSTIEDFHFMRKIVSKLTIKIFNMFSYKKLTDPMSGFFIIKKDFFINLSKQLSKDGYKILADIILNGPKTITVSEISLGFKKRNAGQSKMNLRVLWDFLLIIAYCVLKNYVPRKYLSYIFVGCLGLLTHLIFLYVFYKLLLINFLLSHILATFIAILINFTLNNVLTFYSKNLIGFRWLIGLVNYNIFCSYGLFISYSITKVLSDLNCYWFLAGIIGTFTASIWNFSISKFLVWKDN